MLGRVSTPLSPVAGAALLGLAVALAACSSAPTRASVPDRSIDHRGPDRQWAQRAVEVAMQHKGAPYRWGGEAPYGFDCSGFVRYVYAQVGISLPHNAAMQYQYGIPIARSDLQPGDLVAVSGLRRCGECWSCRRGYDNICDNQYGSVKREPGVPWIARTGSPCGSPYSAKPICRPSARRKLREVRSKPAGRSVAIVRAIVSDLPGRRPAPFALISLVPAHWISASWCEGGSEETAAPQHREAKCTALDRAAPRIFPATSARELARVELDDEVRLHDRGIGHVG